MSISQDQGQLGFWQLLDFFENVTCLVLWGLGCDEEGEEQKGVETKIGVLLVVIFKSLEHAIFHFIEAKHL